MESGLQVFWRVLLGDTSMRKWGSQSGQREKLTHIVVATETSTDPLWSSEAELAPQSCPKLIQWNQIFVSLHQSVTGHELLPRRGHSLGWNSSLCRGKCTVRAVAVSCQEPMFSAAGWWVHWPQRSGQSTTISTPGSLQFREFLSTVSVSFFCQWPLMREEKSRNRCHETQILAQSPAAWP